MSRRVLLGMSAIGAAATGAFFSRVRAQAPDVGAQPKGQDELRKSVSYRKMMAALPYERTTVPGAEALAEWERLRAGNSGWPVVVGDDDSLARIAEQFSIDDPAVFGRSPIPMPSPRSPEAILKLAAKIRFPDDLQDWGGAYSAEDLLAPQGEWPADMAEHGTDAAVGLTVATDLAGKVLDRVHLLRTPARLSWEVPAYLRWGDWNACPPPEYHVAALRLWHERYGAELVGINGDTMNVRVRRRPATREEAMDLARQLYGYCPDIVDQGVGTLSALAATLMTSDWWFFWWD
ncbi:DUF4253 domain-containing protein [Sphingomonas sp. ac-8]|uniref:DUF4253 domain-containing protein n=1 Tax=Sphingomonas sp. ac-8 TaxID=3242977 RepID=UPI003A7FCC69